MKRKIILYFMIIILLTLSLVLTVFWVALTKYYYQGIANTFENHVEAINPIWAKGNEDQYASLQDISDLVIKSYDYDGAELQLLNRDGNGLQSSTGFYLEEKYSIDEDVFSYQTIYRAEKVEQTGEVILAVYTPLMLNEQMVGILRYTTSLTKTEDLIHRLLTYGIWICIGVAALVFLISLRLAHSIVKPFNEIIQVTQRLAKGQFDVRVNENFPNELGEMSRTLNFMTDEIVKANRLKNDFISSISHELRTPLTGIKGWVETMQEPEGLSEEELNFGLEIISSESDRLVNLVEDLLDFSRYESNRIELDLNLIDLDMLIKGVAVQLNSKASIKKITIKLSRTPILMYADGDKIRQVMLNLLDNAIKFSPNGSEILLEYAQRKEMAVIKIHDKGIGIKQEQVNFIMDSFYKADSTSVGAGLGLAISRNIILKHGGKIQIESAFGKGTTVVVNLPLRSEEIKIARNKVGEEE